MNLKFSRSSLRHGLLLILSLAAAPVLSQPLTAEQRQLREIYQELVEIDTSDATGDTTKASEDCPLATWRSSSRPPVRARATWWRG
jgi:hypothetical protein